MNLTDMKMFKKIKNLANTALQKSQLAVRLNRYFKLCFCTQSLENSENHGQYCSVSSIHKVSVFVLTITPNQALCFNGRVGTEYN